MKFPRWMVLVLAGLVLVAAGCSKDNEKESSTGPDPEPPDSDYQASATVATTGQATIETESGAGIRVPMYAVPPTATDQPGSMVFSIERDETAQPTPPAGSTVASDVYRFGPDGFTFAEMVEVTVPVTADVTGKDVMLYRIDPTSGESEPCGGTYNSEARTITAQTYHFSQWYAGGRPVANTAYGAFHVTNLSTTHWLHICVVGYELKYPDVDSNFDGNASCSWAPAGGTIGWNDHGNWYLPQGTYDLCVSMSRAGTVSSLPGPSSRGYVNDAVLSQAWTYTNPVTVPLSFAAPPGTPEDGECDCTPTPSTSVGTGEVQVTLTWHSAQAIDLDLWVTDPTGVMCYYGNKSTTTGGTLDRDNLCYNYENGRPENIYWSNAPAGTYKVQVDLYGDCGNGISSMAFDVRVVSGSVAKTYNGTVSSSNETVQVTTFTVSPGQDFAGQAMSNGSAGTVIVPGEYLGVPVDRPADLPEKAR